VADVAEQGLDIVQLSRDLLAVLRHLVVARIAKNPSELIDLPDEERQAIESIARAAQETDLLRLHNGFSKGFDEVSRGADPRASLEMLLARLALRPPLLPIDELLVRLGALEKRLVTGRTGGPVAASGPAPRVALPKGPPPGSRGREPHAGARPGSASAPIDADDEDPDPAPREPASRATAPPAERTAERPSVELGPAKPEPDVDLAIPADTLERTLALLPSCDRLRTDDAQLAAYVEQTEVLTSNGPVIRLGIQDGFLFERELMVPEAAAKIQTHLIPDFGVDIRLEFTKVPATCSIGTVRAHLRQRERQVQIDELRNHPRVKQAVEVLGARIRQVILPD
jgi:hypothetical protein